MKLTVSIVTHRTDPQMLARALQSVARSHPAAVYIVDNSPLHPPAPSLPEGAGFALEYIPVENRGFGAAHNIAIRDALDAGTDYHLVLNPDVEWEGDALTPLAEYMEANPDVGMAMPRVLYPDGTLQYTCRMLPTPLDLFLKRFMPGRTAARRMRRYLLADADHHRSIDSPYLLGSILLFRAEALQSEGLFDERFFMYPEDIDITRRIHNQWKTLYLPLATVTHKHAAASRHSFRMLRIHMANMIRYFNKWGWFHDPQRRAFNRRLLCNLPRTSFPEPGRG